MSPDTKMLEQRVERIERELAALKSAMELRNGAPWWRQIVGQFEGDQHYDEIVRLGQEMRRAERPE